MSTPRICIVAPEFIGPFPNGGVGTACYWEAVTLGNAGYDVTVLYTGPTERETPAHWETHFSETARFRYVDLSRCVSPVDDARLSRFGELCPEARISELVLAWLRLQPFDLVLFQEFLGHGGRSLQAQRSGHALSGARTATTMHSCRQWIYEGMNRLPAGPGDLAVDFLEKESVRLADRAIAPSRHMADWAASHWRLTAETAVIPYCYDETLAQPPAVVEHAGPFRHLVFFGRLETRKGLHLFCRALVDAPELREHVDRVTFLGKPSSVEGLPSEEFIAAHMAKVPGLEWQIKGDLGSFEAQTWLASQTNVLVVAPSLVDNLPYAVIELKTRRIPFVSTNIGGIPEIVGETNRGALADPTEKSLASVIGRVCREGRLVVDYRSGYEAATANACHLEFVRRTLADPTGPAAVAAHPSFDVVVVNCTDDDVLARLRICAEAGDPSLRPARWLRFDDWRESRFLTPAVFLDARVVLRAECVTQLLNALDQPGIEAATSYFVRESAGREEVIAPLGASLELGWRTNVFGGPCFAAKPSAFDAIAGALVDRTFAFWPAYAAMACDGHSLAMVPAPLYRVAADALRAGGHAEIEAVVHRFHARTPASLDLGWVMKSAFSALGSGGGVDTNSAESSGRPNIGRALYDHLLAIPDDLLATYAGLAPAVDDPFVRGFADVRARLEAVVGRWRTTHARVFVYGAGLHTRMLLTLCPALGPCIGGFIDRQPRPHFLGKPCLAPEDFRDEMADAIVYSSREFEHEMYARMKDARVEHVLLYRESPAPPEVSTAVRLRNRFGHQGADMHALNALYQPPAWATGYVSGEDAAFLQEMIAAHRPHRVVELGVASGSSSAAILHALDQLPTPESRVLHSCDVRPTCYFNDAYATGQACTEMYPAPRARWQREFDMDARRLIQTLPPASVDLTFIDANHSHPWPLLDLLHTSAIAKPGSWVVLHDVDLPIQHPEYQVFGPRWLFEAWPFNKVKGVGPWTSIAAVQMPDDPAALVPMAAALLDKPWEQAPTLWHVDLPAAFAPIRARLEARLAPEAIDCAAN